MTQPNQVSPHDLNRILAYGTDDLPPDARQELEQRFAREPVWKAHYDSLRYLGLERDAAAQDADDLRIAIDSHCFTHLCEEAARTDGEVFFEVFPHLRENRSAEARSSEEWGRHIDACPYCRRMLRRVCGRQEAEHAGLGAGQWLLRDLILDEYCGDELEEATDMIDVVRFGIEGHQLVLLDSVPVVPEPETRRAAAPPAERPRRTRLVQPAARAMTLGPGRHLRLGSTAGSGLDILHFQRRMSRLAADLTVRFRLELLNVDSQRKEDEFVVDVGVSKDEGASDLAVEVKLNSDALPEKLRTGQSPRKEWRMPLTGVRGKQIAVFVSSEAAGRSNSWRFKLDP